MSEGGDLIMSECSYPVSDCSRLRMQMSILSMLEGLSCMFVSRQVILFPLLLGDIVGMGPNLM
jgi:hypothetical protein